jgi:hypothetical protein
MIVYPLSRLSFETFPTTATWKRDRIGGEREERFELSFPHWKCGTLTPMLFTQFDCLGNQPAFLTCLQCRSTSTPHIVKT